MDFSKYTKSLKTPPPIDIKSGVYRIRFAVDQKDLDEVFKLRFKIFNIELKEGLRESFRFERDFDEFDECFHHLIVEDTRSSEIVGTYRIQTYETARAGLGFYTERQFDLSPMPASVIQKSIEVGRACIAENYRKGKVLFCLWKGLAAYLSHFDKIYLMGCASFTGQSKELACKAYDFFLKNNYLYPDFSLSPKPEYFIEFDEPVSSEFEASEIPTLLMSYLKYKGHICSRPCVDRSFNTIDFVVLLSAKNLPETIKKFFFKPGF